MRIEVYIRERIRELCYLFVYLCGIPFGVVAVFLCFDGAKIDK